MATDEGHTGGFGSTARAVAKVIHMLKLLRLIIPLSPRKEGIVALIFGL
jgi:hypothetical protein